MKLSRSALFIVAALVVAAGVAAFVLWMSENAPQMGAAVAESTTTAAQLSEPSASEPSASAAPQAASAAPTASVAPASAHTLEPWVPAAPEGYPERILGQPDAPITMVEYSSLTCPHCAAFHQETLPEIKKAYIDTGKLKLVYRDFPLEPVALGAATLARCSSESFYFRLLETLFSTQGQWARATNPLEALRGYGRLTGMNDETLEACFSNEELLKQIQQVQRAGQQAFGIQSTPSFAINGKVVEGNRNFAYFADLIDKELKAAGVN